LLLSSPTIVELFSRRIAADGPEPALGIKRDGQYHWLTWNDVATDVYKLTAALANLGVEPGEPIAHISENRYEWIITDLAIQLARAVHVPIHPTLSGPQIAWQLHHCDCRFAFLSGPHQAAKLAPMAAELPPDLQFFSYDPSDSAIAALQVTSFTGLCQNANPSEGPHLEKLARDHTTASSLVTILYTSGTTGEPKGVMLTQGNLASNACTTVAAFGEDPTALRLGFLPLSHIFARTCDMYCWIAEGSRLALAESRETVIADCHSIHPTHINAVPYFYDKIYRSLCAAGKQDTAGAVRSALGGSIQRLCAGGAALPDHLYDYFLGQGVPILQGYGLSETSPVITKSTPHSHRRGSCGSPLPGIEVRIAADGEILTRGPHVMPGYYKNDAATCEVLHDGWFTTGDLGHQDADGFLYITGRKKEILVTLGGKNIAPVYLESLLTEDPLILQAMIVGDGKPYLSALIVPNPDVLKTEQQHLGLSELNLAEALTHPQILSLYRTHIDCCLSNVSPHEQVGQFLLLETPFTIDSGLLTPKLTLRRQQIGQHYAAEIAALYQKCER
jgi:long-chain acyl-CoA synthetase